MKNLIRYKWKITGLFIILIIVMCCVPFYVSDIVLEIQYTTSEANQGVAQIFWQTEQKGYNSEKQVTSSINNARTQLDIKDSIGEATEYRIDFTNTEQNFEIIGMRLLLDGKVKWNLSGTKLLTYIQRTENISSYYVNQESVCFETLNSDPMVIFNSAFTDLLKVDLADRNYSNNLLGIVFLIGIYISILSYKSKETELIEGGYEEKAKRERMYGCDFVRGVCAIGIVLFHISSGLTEGAFRPLLLFANGSWGGCLVDIFFLLSGAMLYYNYPIVKSLKKFYYKRWKSLYPMYYIAFSHYYLQIVCRHGNFFYKGNPASLILTILGMDGYFYYKVDSYYILGEWFLGAIVLLYIMYPFVLWMFKHCEKGLIVITLLLWIWQVYFGNFKMADEHHIFSCLVCFVAGMYVIKYKLYEKKLLLIISLVGSVVALHVKLSINGNIMAHFAAGFIFIVLFWIGDMIAANCLRMKKLIMEISGISYAMFLLHHIILGGVLVGFKPINEAEVIILCGFIIVLVAIYAKVLTIINNAVIESRCFKGLEQILKL